MTKRKPCPDKDRDGSPHLCGKCLDLSALERMPKHKTAWRVTLDFETRWQARYVAQSLRPSNSKSAKVRGPVKVVVP